MTTEDLLEVGKRKLRECKSINGRKKIRNTNKHLQKKLLEELKKGDEDED